MYSIVSRLCPHPQRFKLRPCRTERPHIRAASVQERQRCRWSYAFLRKRIMIKIFSPRIGHQSLASSCHLWSFQARQHSPTELNPIGSRADHHKYTIFRPINSNLCSPIPSMERNSLGKIQKHPALRGHSFLVVHIYIYKMLDYWRSIIVLIVSLVKRTRAAITIANHSPKVESEE